MLTPADYRQLEAEISRIYSRIEADLVRRVCHYLSGFDSLDDIDIGDWRIRKLEQMPLLDIEIRQALKDGTVAIEGELAEAVTYTVNKSMENDHKVIEAIMRHQQGGSGTLALSLSLGKMQEQRIRSVIANARMGINLTNTYAEQATQRAFLDSVNKAYLSVLEGSDTLQNAVWKASKQLCRRGVTVATYSSGSAQTISIDSAVRRNVVTSVGQATAEATLERNREYGLDLVKTSAHAGARPDHFKWQGKVFSVSGTSDKYPPLSASQEEGGTGYGTAGGLCGCNCRHSFYTWVEGFEPAKYGLKISEEDNEELYRASQRQRECERQIRGWKRTEDEAKRQGMMSEATFARQKVKEWQTEVRKVIEASGLQRQYDRERS